MAKAKTKTTTARKTTARKSSARTAAAKRERAALEAERIDMATTSDPQSGGANIIGDKPTLKQAREHRKAEVEAQFAAADAKGTPSAQELAEIRVGLQVRGY